MTEDDDDEDGDGKDENPVTVDIRCACGNHARYLVLSKLPGLACSLCAMKSPYETVRLADNPKLVAIMNETQTRMAFDALCAAAHMARVAKGKRNR